ncbi:hypothetical protein SAMN05444404_3232 [Ruegeria lacuscaerulensis ITI-1157]|nr:hypothetical protein SAMN05444404_3232 [Ruegeria lacuscaerulensis ITI-1157]
MQKTLTPKARIRCYRALIKKPLRRFDLLLLALTVSGPSLRTAIESGDFTLLCRQTKMLTLLMVAQEVTQMGTHTTAQD